MKKLKSVEIGQKFTELEPCQVAEELRVGRKENFHEAIKKKFEKKKIIFYKILFLNLLVDCQQV